jgi:hypothetical protein
VTEFVPEEILRILNKHEVRYVLIGGLAATFYGSVTPTFDVDITPEMTQQSPVSGNALEGKGIGRLLVPLRRLMWIDPRGSRLPADNAEG